MDLQDDNIGAKKSVKRLRQKSSLKKNLDEPLGWDQGSDNRDGDNRQGQERFKRWS